MVHVLDWGEILEFDGPKLADEKKRSCLKKCAAISVDWLIFARKLLFTTYSTSFLFPVC